MPRTFTRLVVASGLTLILSLSGLVADLLAESPRSAASAPKQDEYSWSTAAFQLLMLGEVQSELRLTGTQRTQLSLAFRTISGKYKAFQKSLRDAAPEEISAKTIEFVDGLEEMHRDCLAEILKDLQPAQHRRFKELCLQHAGVHCFSRDEIARELALTPAQRKAIRAILTPPEPNEPLSPFGTIEEDAKTRLLSEAKVLTVMTDEQKAKWKALCGEKFQFRERESVPQNFEPQQSN